ncbi:MAG: hypothetical protein V3U35_09105 [Candidatus Neomarinimicrobiota bacterium]
MAQQWVAKGSIPLPAPAEGLVSLVASTWSEGFFLLDGLSLEVLSVDGQGDLRRRFGGWGDGPLSLDFPRDLAVAENSVFVLDQGRHQVLRLDARLNPVSRTPLPEDYFPALFARDARQRFWVVFENRAGLHLFDDQGTLLDVVGDEASGSAAILHPTLIAASPNEVAVWDAMDRSISILHLSGRQRRRLPLEWEGAVRAMVWSDEHLILAADNALLQFDPADGTVRPLALSENAIDLAYRSSTLYGLVPSGAVHAFHSTP